VGSGTGVITYYDGANQRLVYVGAAADESFWDSRWQAENFERRIKASAKQNRFYITYTQKYLPKGSKILEGGCGRGDKVYSLHTHGYQAYGIDFAKETIKKINAYAPELAVTVGDVRQLDFPDGHFDGYWSLGVIEHFYEGYDPILREMYRVLRNGGYLFLAVPAMSWLRRQKAKWGKYPPFQEKNHLKGNFYQFALDSKHVIPQFQRQGFKLLEVKPLNGLKGFKDETKIFPDRFWESRAFPIKLMRKALDILVTPFANHGTFYIFKKLG
jgi:SAM-dependent methyltransferase